MSTDLFRLGAKFRAIAEKRAVATTNRARVVVRPDALAFSVAAMSGVHASLWAVGLAPVKTSTTEVMTVGEPRNWRDQLTLWQQVGTVLVAYGEQCLSAGVAPQLVVSTRPAWEVIEANAERLCRSDDDVARAAAELVMFCGERSGLAGSQCLVIASEALSAHLATGSEDADEAGLGVMLAWSTGLPERLAQRLARAPEHADELWTPVEMDKGHLAKYVDHYNKQRMAGKDEMANMSAHSIKTIIRPLIKDRHQRIVEAIGALKALGLPPVKQIEKLVEEDASAWSRWADARKAGYRVARKDSPKAAVLALMAREEAAEQWERALLWNDDWHLAAAAAGGTVLQGDVLGIAGEVLVVRSKQDAVRLRVGEEVAWRADARVRLQVQSMDRIAGGLIVELRATTKKGVLPGPGHEVTMCSPPPDYGAAIRKRVQAAQRLKELPWAYTSDHPAPKGSRSVPSDILAIAEGLRA